MEIYQKGLVEGQFPQKVENGVRIPVLKMRNRLCKKESKSEYAGQKLKEVKELTLKWKNQLQLDTNIWILTLSKLE